MIYYANGVASAKTKELVSGSLFEQMINTKDYDSCLSLVLSTSFFSQYDGDVDLILKQKKEELYDFIKTNSPSQEVSDFFLLAQDFDNFGVIYRLASVGKNLHNTDFVCGYSSKDDLIFLYQTGKSDNVSKYIVEAFSSIPKELTLAQIDLYFKKKKYETLKLLMKNKILKELLENNLDLQNVSILLRVKTKEEFLENRVGFGRLDREKLLKIFDKDKTVLFGLLGLTKDIASICFEGVKEKSFEKINKFANELWILTLSQYVKDTDSVAPFLEYCFCCLNQLKNIKMILSIKKNNVECNLKAKLLEGKYD